MKYATDSTKERCAICNQLVDGILSTAELSNTDGKYYLNGIPANHTSQGCFTVHSKCAIGTTQTPYERIKACLESLEAYIVACTNINDRSSLELWSIKGQIVLSFLLPVRHSILTIVIR